MTSPWRREFAAVLGLVALKVLVSLWALRVGFTHVSDDDYARVTIAQAFAHAPRLDPSGTSWLPFPFWLNGGAMMVFGRSLAVARVVAVASAAVGAALVYLALRRLPVVRWVAWTSVALAMCLPWSVWLGAATVPEALCAALIVVGALSIGQRERHLAGAACLLLASLSRYEAWPVAGLFGVVCLLGARSGPRAARGRDVVAAGIAVMGPVLWVVWNRYAHGDGLHFLARVATYRRQLGGIRGSWMVYPVAFVRAGPEAVVLLAAGGAAWVTDGGVRARWGWPLLAVVAMGLFLVVGELNDGAPTHHPERAVLAGLWVGTLFGLDGLARLVARLAGGRPVREAWVVAGVVGVGVSWVTAWPARTAAFPGNSAAEDRTTAIALGESLRRRDPAHVGLVPCAYEYFAVIAAFRAPERVTVEPRPSTVDPSECPRIVE